MKQFSGRFFALAAVIIAAVAVVSIAGIGRPPQTVTLRMRTDNGPYKDSAYSFLKESTDESVHHNYVDLLYNKCGSLHVKMFAGQQNRVCDLGANTLIDAPKVAPGDAKWMTDSIKPVTGHVYLEQMNHGPQTMTVKFRVEAVGTDTIQFTWMTINAASGHEAPGQGAAGTKGQCGAPHEDH